MSLPTPTIVVHLNIELPRHPDTLAALSELLHSVAELPGVAVTQQAVPELPYPRSSTADAVDERLRIVPYSRTVLRRGRPIPLTRLEFDLLLYLTQRPKRVLPRRTLMAEVWGIDEPLNSRTVDVHIRRLRDKLGPDRPRITTVRGVGYRFDGPQDVVIESAPEWAVV
ncbi:winged helix-turn-helix domain-containing protein [Actinophytocola algeriensis]|uniref:DNA-binding response OmpR family regulator n=1 Tax=Actinophytocola algeriensis TaxID=1768010 RepID=A0A7W7Q9R4_9PSEU|nr:winged helix-turn-helix domain-containing protein [Actinophytocola algeriensis]MBB4909625.1 DNA-binding response OmpR family regulator [Actinophytocola algeriensis]MBE1475615.1 DNA-binding response OmpR family regulator [Actinophytocola algeriensis]